MAFVSVSIAPAPRFSKKPSRRRQFGAQDEASPLEVSTA